MEKFIVYIDLPKEEIIAAYKHFFGEEKKPTRKELAKWIGDLAQADIGDRAPDSEEDEPPTTTRRKKSYYERERDLW